MAYFTWKETGLTGDCASLEAMASRFEEAAALMRRMASEGFVLERHSDGQHITHRDAGVFAAYGFIEFFFVVGGYNYNWSVFSCNCFF